MSTPFDVRRWAGEAGIQTTGGFAVVAECVTMDELERFAQIVISTAAKHWQREHALKAALAEPEQEPVAWYDPTSRNVSTNKHDANFSPLGQIWPLYTAPPQRKPLTEEEIINIGMGARAVEGPHILPVTFARAVERAHGIGEKE